MDASETSLGPILSLKLDGEEHPIIFISRKLTPTKERYTSVEQEALTIKWAVDELQYYLTGGFGLIIYTPIDTHSLIGY